MAAFSFVVTNFVHEPVSRIKAREMVAEAYADLLSSVIEEKTFRSIEDGLYVQISERHSGRVLTGIFMVDYRDPNWDLIYYAREGSIAEDGKTLTMRDGEVHRKSGRAHFDYQIPVLCVRPVVDGRSTGEAPVFASDRNLDFSVEA